MVIVGRHLFILNKTLLSIRERTAKQISPRIPLMIFYKVEKSIEEDHNYFIPPEERRACQKLIPEIVTLDVKIFQPLA